MERYREPSLKDKALEIGRRIISAYARRFGEKNSLDSHREYIRSHYELLARSQALREAVMISEVYPEYLEDLEGLEGLEGSETHCRGQLRLEMEDE